MSGILLGLAFVAGAFAGTASVYLLVRVNLAALRRARFEFERSRRRLLRGEQERQRLSSWTPAQAAKSWEEAGLEVWPLPGPEREQGELCTCTVACVPAGLVGEQVCRQAGPYLLDL